MKSINTFLQKGDFKFKARGGGGGGGGGETNKKKKTGPKSDLAF